MTFMDGAVMLKKLFFLSLLFINSYAFNLSPLSQSIILGRDKNSVIFQVENKNKEPIAIEASLKVRQMNELGVEELPEVEENLFLIYPLQLVLKPGEKRGIKIQYLGDDKIKKEGAYRLLVEQLPIDFKKQKTSGVKLLLRYLGALYVSKEEFHSNVVVKKILNEDNGLRVEVENLGKNHQVLKNLKIVLNNEKDVVVLEASDLEGMNGENILGESRRIFKLKNSKNLKISQKASAKLKFE